MFGLDKLNEWLAKHAVESLVLKMFWLNFESYRIEEPEEFNSYFENYDVKHLIVKIKSAAINYSNNYPSFDYNHVIITMTIDYQGKEVGFYKLLLNFDGSIADDFFVLN